MMNKRILASLCAVLALCIAMPAMAAPVMTGGGYTAYLGQENYLYLKDAEGVTKVLQHPIADLVGMDETRLYCLTRDGKLYAIMLDGSATSIVSAAPTPEELASAAAKLPYTLEEAVLTLTQPDGSTFSAATGVLLASATEDELYFIQQTAATHMTLRRIALPLTGLTPAQESLISLYTAPVSLIATPDAVTILDEAGRVTVYDTLLGSLANMDAPEGAVQAMVVDGKMIYLGEDEKGQLTVLSAESYTLGDQRITTTPTPAVTSSPTPTVKPTATPAPTKAPSSSSSSGSSEDDGRISKGESGSHVRKMQKRLSALGYPVGTVDGDFGNNTLLAVNLFQCAIGYRERTYASAGMLDRLYARTAPSYDPYAPLREGDEGTDVKIMQTRLDELGYDLGKKEIDGKFGKDTRKAVERFQLLAGLDVTGEATAETLKRLFDEENPVHNSTSTPTPEPADPPADGDDDDGEEPVVPPTGGEGDNTTETPDGGGNSNDNTTNVPDNGGTDGDGTTATPEGGNGENPATTTDL